LYLSIVEKNKYGKQISYTNDEISVKILNDYVPEFVGKIWYTNHCSEEIMNDVSTITNQIIANYSKQIKEWEWLNTGSRYNLVEMISKAKVLVGHSSFSDYSKLELKESFFESILEVIKYEKHLQKEKLFTTFDAYEWIMPPQICNAYYNSTNNSINICAGYIYGSGYNINWSFEKKMACIGSIISHEISHVFCMYNFNDGSLIHRLLSGDDQKILQEKLNSLADLFSAHEILPGNYFKGKYCQGEIGADFFAMNFMMNYSKDFPGFDYKKFFETYAEISFEKYSEEIQNIYMNSDSHPPYYLRVNGILQQFDEFYETYNIQKKDGMYLSEKNRVKL
ncbi:MAG: hypothetical protein HUJ68_12330, partial [Clostridia bacterium]|nr:hypothetical protein [Clostridia bacterium]